MQALRAYLSGIRGPIQNVKEVEELLASNWEEFTGDGGGMEASKLFDRLKHVHWNPPHLAFRIQRHGGTVHGSTRADVQQWSLNIDTAVASLMPYGFRQLKPQQPALDMRSLVKEIVHLVEQERSDPRVKRHPDGSVQVLIGQILPNSGPAQTVEGRRRRFRKALREGLLSLGWSETDGKAPYGGTARVGDYSETGRFFVHSS